MNCCFVETNRLIIFIQGCRHVGVRPQAVRGHQLGLPHHCGGLQHEANHCVPALQ